ncbi:MAG: glycoside hydrolase family 3 C-terminal domain-containing protein [Bacteroidales bacterium]|nr:glycoside hydrolase family 3 C-terminal domain-containing protein [Bacteroidales bacterium]
MRNLTTFLSIAILLAFNACQSPQSNKKDAIGTKIDSLISLMTIEEKVGQLTLYTSDMDQTGAYIRKEYESDIKQGKVGAIFNAYGADYTRRLQEMAVNSTRLRIPLLFGYDVIHGHRTIFPVPLAEAASWNISAIQNAARIAAEEATAEGLHWTFAPMCDISRDPRWGRMVEGAGEDPFLASLIAEARVKGFQGDDLASNNTLAACVKHLAAYGASQAGRDYHAVDMSENILREVYLPPYKAAVDAGAVTVMTSFNDLNGIPATANKFLLTDLLRDEWGFEGFVVTDYTSIMELLHHGVAADTAEAAAISLKAGVDMDMQSGFFQKTLPTLVENKQLDEALIDEAVRRILKVKFQLGLFDDPYRYISKEREENDIMNPAQLEAARDMAKRSIVLLRNEKQTLPISTKVKNIAVIGPMGDNKRDMIGSWSAAGDWSKSVSLMEGLQARYPGANIQFAKGCEIEGTDKTGFREAKQIAEKADFVILALGEAYWMSGEAASRSTIDLPGVQQELAALIIETGKPTATIIFSGRPLTINWLAENSPALLQAWFLGTQSGHALADVVSGYYNPSGKLPVTFPRNVGQIPIYYSMKNTGRPFDANNKYTSKYLDVPNEPLYAFGYGLSYTKFVYSKLQMDKHSITAQDSIRFSLEVQNTGKLAGEEVVQVYVHDQLATITRPVRELKAFKNVFLKPGETQKISFSLPIEALYFYKADLSYGSEPGKFTIFAGGDSNASLSTAFELR